MLDKISLSLWPVSQLKVFANRLTSQISQAVWHDLKWRLITLLNFHHLWRSFGGRLRLSKERMKSYPCSINSHVVHTHWTSYVVSQWWVWLTKSQFNSWILSSVSMDSKSMLLLARFGYGPSTCSHCTKVWHRTYPIRDGPPSARHSFALSLTEIASKSPFVFVNRISFRYGFRASVRAIWYRVNIASNMQNWLRLQS